MRELGKLQGYLVLVFGVCLVSNFALSAHAQTVAPTPLPANDWSRVKKPTAGSPTPTGFYSAGCMSGAATLPLDGTGYQVMRTSRNRYYGHPEMIQVVQDLAKTMDSAGSAILVGDMAQPRGGPLPYGHDSHQVGLDVDVWFWTHPEQRVRKLTYDERENLPFITMLDAKGHVNANVFGDTQILKLKTTSSNDHVQRIFVNPAIKAYLCTTLPATEHTWLHKLRPWPGHDEHFHIRIKCPVGSTQCTPQDVPIPDGDGCADAIKQAADPQVLPNEEPVNPMPTLPAACAKILKE